MKLKLFFFQNYIYNNLFSVVSVFGRFVMDVIGRAGFSLDFGTFSEDEGGENMLLQHARKALNPGRKLYFLIVMCERKILWMKSKSLF
jgi:hypothetical protein